MAIEKKYDVIIVGGSYSGMAAGMALGRALRHVLIIDSGNPCNKTTLYSHNFITNDGKSAQSITETAKKQIQLYKTVEIYNAIVVSANQLSKGFEIHLATGEIFISKKLVFATGIKDIMPDIPGFKECWGNSVVHCPYCHGYELRNEKTGVLANGESSYYFTALISNWAKDLTLFTNGVSLLTETQKNKLLDHNIEQLEKEIAYIEHKEGNIQYLVFKDDTKIPLSVLYTIIPFEQHSSIPQELGCELTDNGYIHINRSQKTTVYGVFACGDNSSRTRTIANAVAMGTTTGLTVNQEIINDEF